MLREKELMDECLRLTHDLAVANQTIENTKSALKKHKLNESYHEASSSAASKVIAAYRGLCSNLMNSIKNHTITIDAATASSIDSAILVDDQQVDFITKEFDDYRNKFLLA